MDIANNMNKTITITTVLGLALGNFLAGYLLEVSFEKMGAMSFAQAVAAATLYFYHRNK